MKQLKSMRLHIAVFGKTNVGKSSLINKITGQDVSIVSEIAGTTTDVVEKSMELPPIGAVTFLDTAGLDDTTDLGVQRVEKTKKVINRTDVAVIVVDGFGLGEYENVLIKEFAELKIPYLIVVNKSDIEQAEIDEQNVIYTSAVADDKLIYKFKSAMLKLLPEDFVETPKIVGDLVPEKSVVVLVTPIDKEAPKGRMILPQVQVLRDLLDSHCVVVFATEKELPEALSSLKEPPALVVTDSQAFKTVDEIVPNEVPLTSFSILYARLKGDLEELVNGAKAIDSLKDGDKVLILESCTHHAIEDDIATVKIPRWLKKKTGSELIFEYSKGHDFPNVEGYSLLIHCGACMTNKREVLSRIIKAGEAGVPMTNYGVAISYCLGILPRALKIFDL